MTQEAAFGPLQGVKVLELGHVMAGPVCGMIPIYNIKEVLENEQTRARNMLTEVPHQSLGKTKTIGTPVKFSLTPSEVRRGAPVLGQHSREILSEIGFSTEEIANMEKDKIVTSNQ